jgi:hypothetical protein
MSGSDKAESWQIIAVQMKFTRWTGMLFGEHPKKRPLCVEEAEAY